MRNELRIIGGHWRSRRLPFPTAPGLRPTPARIRETLFNWLQLHVQDARCLDLFAGSGALGFEAASRRAKHVLQVERNSSVLNALKENINRLSALQVAVVHADVTVYLSQTSSADPFDIVFMDPPFDAGLILPCAQLLEANGWLAERAWIYLEAARGFTWTGLPDNWQLTRECSAGEVCSRLYQRVPASTAPGL